MRNKKESIKRFTVPLSMVLVQILATGMLFLSKLALSQGMFVFALLAYRNAIGSIFVAPLAFFLERGFARKLNGTALMWIFINAFFANPVALGMYYYGLRYTSASYAINFVNVNPVVTFICAAILRLERFGLGSKGGRMKILGTFVCVGGAMVISLYKGKALHLFHHVLIRINTTESFENQDLLRGTLFLICSCFGYAMWAIAMVKLFKVFPFKYWGTMLTCLVGCLQSAVAGVIIDRRKATWSLKWDLQLATIVYSGILNTGVSFCLILWAVAERGPIYPTAFNSLSLIFTVVIACLFMGQDLTVGSLLGSCLIISGLYAFLWGKNQEVLQNREKDQNIEATSDESPA